VSAYLSAFALTIANPATILSFAAVFAGLGLSAKRDYIAAASLVSGVFLGSTAWWLLLSGGVGLLHGSGRTAWMRQINRLSGVILISFGIYTIGRQFR
jgi:putative LysE/RhtB family amino acid efflux pump